MERSLPPKERSSRALAVLYESFRPKDYSREQLAETFQVPPVVLLNLESGKAHTMKRVVLFKIFENLPIDDAETVESIKRLIVGITRDISYRLRT